MNHLFLFTIGPVQSFIAQARKTIDLFAGSAVLSEWTDYCISGLPQNAQVIFPHPEVKSKPNRFLAVVPGSPDEIRSLGKNLEFRLREKFLSDLRGIFQKNNITKQETIALAENQVRDFLQIHWAAIPDEGKDYSQAYRELESLLGATKNSKVFSQNSESGRKCSLDGVRDALFFQSDRNDKRLSFLNPNAVSTGGYFQISPGEGLSAVSFFKRFAFSGKSASYPSTAEVSLYDTIAKLERANSKVLEEYKGILPAMRFEDQLYYEENLNEEYFNRQGLKSELELLPAMKDKQKELAKEAKKHSVKFSKYYAVIAMDGDNMGSWLDGSRLKDTGQLRDFHSKLSKALADFAAYSSKLITRPKGRVVYAGGDDLFAFVNLNHLTGVLMDLKKAFADLVDSPLRSYIRDPQDILSFSAGIAVAHYKTPLSEVVQIARDMEKEAKSNPGKDSATLAILKHSGEFSKSTFTLKGEGKDNALTALKKLTDSMGMDYYSGKYTKNIVREFLPFSFGNPNRAQASEYEPLILTEGKRLVGRACKVRSGSGSEKLPAEFSDEKIVEAIQTLYRQAKDMESFFYLLSASEFLHRSINYEA